MTAVRISIEQRVVDSHVDWMREHYEGLRLLDIHQLLPASSYLQETRRRLILAEAGIQLATDAFRRGLAIIALAKPQYLVHPHLGAWNEARDVRWTQPEWVSEPPAPESVDSTSTVEIKLEAYGFPIGIREV